MERRELVPVGIAVILVGITTGALYLYNEDSTQQQNIENQELNASTTPAIEFEDGEYNETEDGVKYRLSPDELMQGCPNRDCFPSIDDPNYISVEEADEFIENDEKVMNVEVDGENRAYPLKILRNHEIVNTELNEEPLAVTYCPLCRSGVVHNREVNGQTLEFGVSGKLYQANLIMYDRQTETYWTQIGGKAVIGEMVPTILDIERNQITSWNDWKEANPDSEVLSRETDTGVENFQYERNPYSDFSEQDALRFNIDDVDPRLEGTEVVKGIETGKASKAFPEDTLREQELINTEIGDTPVTVFINPEDNSPRAFEREINNQTLEFNLEDNILVDNSGGEWSVSGEAISEEHEGESLEELNTSGFYWFAWEKFQPETEVYKNT